MLNPRRQYSSPSSPTTLGIDERWERVLCYALGWITGLIFLFVEQRNATVRAHARQSILVFGVLSILAWLASVLGSLFGGVFILGGLFGAGFGLIGLVVGVVTFVAWIGLMVLAFMGPTTFVGNRGRYF